MKYISLTICLCILYSCYQSKKSNVTDGLWRIRKVEVLKNNELKKVIDTGYQYWNFNKKSMIEIFDTHKIQNVLHIKIADRSIKSYNNQGDLQDEFFVHEINDNSLSLSSCKKLDNQEYNIVYYLNKVRDTTAETIKEAF